MTENEIAWLAGYLEGEGSFVCHPIKKHLMTLKITFQSTDEDVSKKAASLMKANINGPYHRQGRANRKPYWTVHISGDRAVSLMQLLLPQMGIRRSQQINNSILKWTSRTFLKRRAGLPPDCHPGRKHYAKGLCGPCYARGVRSAASAATQPTLAF
jgi:hypothetical protein